MKTLIRFSTVKIRFLFHPFTSRKSLYVWHKLGYHDQFQHIAVFKTELGAWGRELEMFFDTSSHIVVSVGKLLYSLS